MALLLAAVARLAGRDEVVGGIGAAERDRGDVIDAQRDLSGADAQRQVC